MKKIIGIVIWALVFALSLILLFILAKEINTAVITTCIFDVIAFVGAGIFLMAVMRKDSTPDDNFLHLPAAVVSCVYMIIQIIICVVFALMSLTIPFKAVLLVNLVIAIICWIIMLCSIAGIGHIQKVNSRQKDHHTEL